MSVEAEACPNCGAPYPVEGEATARRLAQQKKGEGITGGVLSAIAVVVLAAVAAYLFLRATGRL